MGGHDRLTLALTLPLPLNPDPDPTQVATIVALAIDGGEPTMDGLVRLLDRAGLIRKAPTRTRTPTPTLTLALALIVALPLPLTKAPLVKGSRVLGCRDEETWEEGDIAEVLEVRTAEQEASLEDEPSDGPKSPSRGGDRTNRENGEKKFKPYTRYSP